ncbi:MAG: BTAD domain-containing putative transcriptional regulator [Candidatus Bruticola sp.]
MLEDDASLRGILSRALQDEGFEVTAASRGEYAVVISSRKLFDLIVLDTCTVSFEALLPILTVHSHLREAAVLALTRCASEEDSIRSLRSGTTDCLRQPFELETFLNVALCLIRQNIRYRQNCEYNLRLQALHSWSIHTLLSSFSKGKFSSQVIKTAQHISSVAKNLALQAGLEAPTVQEIEIHAVLHLLKQGLKPDYAPSNTELWEDSFTQNYSHPKFALARQIISSSISAAEAAPNSQEQEIPKLELFLLGQCSICLNGQLIDDRVWVTQKIKYLFLRLISSNTDLTSDQLIEEFWPDSSGQTNLWKALSVIKKIFRQICPNFIPIMRNSASITFNSKLHIEADWRLLEYHWSEYRSQKLLQHLISIKKLSRGHFLPQCSMEWAEMKRVHLDYISQQALMKLAHHEYSRKDWSAAIETASQAATLDPLNEECTHLLMQAYSASHQPHLAMQTFEVFRKNIKKYLDASPSPQLLETYHKMYKRT